MTVPHRDAPAVLRLLVANRGEIALRIMRSAAELGIITVAVYAEDDAAALHVLRADERAALRGAGPAAYLDIEQIVAAAKRHACDALHPGYGFLSENPQLARRCAEEGIRFVGPDVATLTTLGDKSQARRLAARLGVPLLRGSDGPVTVEEARDFLTSLGAGGAMVIKAVAGGGGRGLRMVSAPEEVEPAYTRCRSEALHAFGNGDLYVEERMSPARHIEVQVIGDGSGAVSHLWERECSLQRRHQKLVEIAPCPGLHPDLRQRLTADAVRIAQELRYRGLGTFEFLVDAELRADARYAFIEANARLQVEHTVTEEVLGQDLVRAQLLVERGYALADMELTQAQIPQPRGFAIQARINTETMSADGTVRPTGGTLRLFEPPSGRGVRVDTAGHAGYTAGQAFDPLLAKLICYSPSGDFAAAVAKLYRALCEFRIDGVRTNLPLLQSICAHPELAAGRISTEFIGARLAELLAQEAAGHPRLYTDGGATRTRAGAAVSADDPLAVLAYGKSGNGVVATPVELEEPATDWPAAGEAGQSGVCTVRAPLQATIVSLDVAEGEPVRLGQQLLVLNAMKMEHVISAPAGGVVLHVEVEPGDTVYQGTPLLALEVRGDAGDAVGDGGAVDLDQIRPDLAAVLQRRKLTEDAGRAEPVARRHATGHRTARENIDDLFEPGSFVEYGRLAVAHGLRGTLEERISYAPADGLVMGHGRVNGDLFDAERARCMGVAYDYTVLAGTQGGMNHKKMDRIFQTAERLRLPLVLFAEGGGGRAGGGSRNSPAFRGGGVDAAGEGEISGGGGLGTPSWTLLGRLSGLVPTVGITTGRCFAGNAALLGLCDVIIATPDANIGMGGPAMVEGGGLGVFRPEEIGPMSVQVPNGVVDVAVRDEAEAVRAAKQYLSYFQGRLSRWECADQRLLRSVVPENRLRVYNVREVISTLADTGSVLELRRGFGLAMVTALARLEGRPVGIIANNPLHLSGAIDSDAADKAARFMQLCDAFDIPLVMLCDTPGIMVGPEVEKTALVRHAARMWAAGSSITVPVFTVVLRKAYGLGAQTMGGGNHRVPSFIVSWPTGEFGGMGLEGQVKLGRRRDLEAVASPGERLALYEQLVTQAYDRGKALNAAHVFEIDDVIDPADTRHLLIAGLEAAPVPAPRAGKKRPCIDTW